MRKIIMRGARAAGGFTLVELLVVMAIMSILAAMLLPAMSQALTVARLAVCSNNMRQQHVAMTLYADDMNGWLPPYYNGWGEHAYGTNLYIGEPNDNIWSGYPAYMRKTMTGVFFCPGIRRPSDSAAWSATAVVAPLSFTSYRPTIQGDNQSLPGGGCYTYTVFTPVWRIVTNRKLQTVRPESVILLEKNYMQSSGINGSTFAIMGDCSVYPYADAATAERTHFVAWDYHRGAANFLFSSGQVKAHRYSGENLFDFQGVPLH